MLDGNRNVQASAHSRLTKPGPWVLAVALGFGAAGLDTLGLPMLSPETPLFVFGSSLVFVAFLSMGLGPGLVAVLTAYIVRLAIMWPFQSRGRLRGHHLCL